MEQKELLKRRLIVFKIFSACYDEPKEGMIDKSYVTNQFFDSPYFVVREQLIDYLNRAYPEWAEAIVDVPCAGRDDCFVNRNFHLINGKEL